jgi:hypothetical protein
LLKYIGFTVKDTTQAAALIAEVFCDLRLHKKPCEKLIGRIFPPGGDQGLIGEAPSSDEPGEFLCFAED